LLLQEKRLKVNLYNNFIEILFVRVLLVDDHFLFRGGLKSLLYSIDKYSEILEVDCGKDAIAFVDNDDNIDVVLLDYDLGDISGLDVLNHIKENNPEIPVIMLSAHETPSLIQDLLTKGASGFITKTSSPDVMLSAVNLVLSGGMYVPPAMLAPQEPTSKNYNSTPYIINEYNQKAPSNSTIESRIEIDHQLTDRQVGVLRELSGGLSNKEIARVLDISPSTVKVHVAAILKELGAKNRTVAVTMAKDMGLFN